MRRLLFAIVAAFLLFGLAGPMATPTPALASTATNSPTATTGTWTNPTNAYADNGAYASKTSGTPSDNQTYSGYGFSLNGNTITRSGLDMTLGLLALLLTQNTNIMIQATTAMGWVVHGQAIKCVRHSPQALASL